MSSCRVVNYQMKPEACLLPPTSGLGRLHRGVPFSFYYSLLHEARLFSMPSVTSHGKTACWVGNWQVGRRQRPLSSRRSALCDSLLSFVPAYFVAASHRPLPTRAFLCCLFLTFRPPRHLSCHLVFPCAASLSPCLPSFSSYAARLVFERLLFSPIPFLFILCPFQYYS